MQVEMNEIIVFIVMFLLFIISLFTFFRVKSSMKGGEYMRFVTENNVEICPSISQIVLLMSGVNHYENRASTPTRSDTGMKRLVPHSHSDRSVINVSPLNISYSPLTPGHKRVEINYQFDQLNKISADLLLKNATFMFGQHILTNLSLLSMRFISDANLDLYGIKELISNGYAACEYNGNKSLFESKQLISSIDSYLVEGPLEFQLKLNEYTYFNIHRNKTLPKLNSNCKVYIEFVYNQINEKTCYRNAYINIHKRTVDILKRIINLSKEMRYNNIFIYRCKVNNDGSINHVNFNDVFANDSPNQNELLRIYDHIMNSNVATHSKVIVFEYLKKQLPKLCSDRSFIEKVNRTLSKSVNISAIQEVTKEIKEKITMLNETSLCNSSFLTKIGQQSLNIYIYDDIKAYNIFNYANPLFENIQLTNSNELLYDEWLSFEANKNRVDVQIEHSEKLSNHKSNIVDFIVRNTKGIDQGTLMSILTNGLTYKLNERKRINYKGSIGGIMFKEFYMANII